MNTWTLTIWLAVAGVNPQGPLYPSRSDVVQIVHGYTEQSCRLELSRLRAGSQGRLDGTCTEGNHYAS